MKPTGTELDVLRVVDEAGGTSTLLAICQKLRINNDYGRTLLMSLGRGDYLDVTAKGLSTLTDKGRTELERKGLASLRD